MSTVTPWWCHDDTERLCRYCCGIVAREREKPEPEGSGFVPGDNARSSDGPAPVEPTLSPSSDDEAHHIAPGDPATGGKATRRGFRRKRNEPRTLKRTRRTFEQRQVEWVEAPATIGALLAEVGAETRCVYLLGDRPGGGTSAGLRAWATGELPEGWRHHEQGHWLTGRPVLRYVDYYERELEVHSARAWFGDRATTPAQCAEAWQTLGELIAGAFDEGKLVTTPATTGRYLLARSIPFGREWPVLADDEQDLIRATSGQGRIEMLGRTPAQIPGMVRLDGRWMYSALCWGLGSGPVQHDTRSEWEEQRRGRYRVAFTVPKDWGHVGILPVHEGDGWAWPSAPGATGESWCDGAELRIAIKHGWRCEIRERVLLAHEGVGPLDGWATRLRKLRAGTTDEAVRYAIRAILLFGLGAMHGADHKIMHAGTIADVPDDADGWTMQGDTHVWYQSTGQAWPEMCHPEWTAAVWARCRARLLDGPGKTGMLHLNPATLIACRTDAIYTTDDPGWPDDGTEGRYRVTGQWGPMTAPATSTELLATTGGD